MEAVGLAVGLVSLFSTCLEAVQRIDSYKTAGRDSRLLRAQLNATMHLFERWGDSVGIGKGKLSDNHHPALDDPKNFSVVKSLLKSFEEFSLSTITYDATSSASKTSRWQKTSWALRGKLKQTNHVEALTSLVSELYSVVSPDTAVIASVRQKPFSRTTGFKHQHGTETFSDPDAASGGQPNAVDVREILLELQQELKAEALQTLRSWLGSPPPNHVYTESKDKRLQQTCEWMLHRQEFLEWQAPSTSDKLLWIKGPAGFGKTVLCSRLVEEAEKTTKRPMAYFFLSSNFEGRDDPFSAIRSWLTTVISKNPVALDTIRSRYVPEHEQVALQTTVLQLFHDVVLKLPGCTFILDGLDECTGMNGTDSKSVACFLEKLKKAISNTGTRLLFSSRGDPIIQQGLYSFPGYTEYTIQSTDVGPDLGIYSSTVVKERLPNKDETRESIAQKIKFRCQGQFQWIKLQEGSLRKGRSKRQLEREIDETPSGLDGLYDREWSRIMSMGATDRARALCLLGWAAFSMRPLTVYEITEAVLMTEDCEEFPHDVMPDSIDKDYVDSMILNLCGSLIELRRCPVNEVEQQQNTKNGGIYENIDRPNLLQQSLSEHDVGLQEVYLTHFSVKEYLLHKIAPNDAGLLLHKSLRISLEQLENMALSKYCIRYLNLPGAWDDWRVGHEKSTMQFLFYAAKFWLPHYTMAETPDSNLRDEVNAFFDDRNQSFWLWRSWCETAYTRQVGADTLPFPMGPLELASALGLKDPIKNILNDRKYDSKGHLKHNVSALHYTCSLDDQETAELLIESGLEVDLKSDEGITPLMLAIDRGNSSVAELLISKGANILLADSHGTTPLHLASQQGDLNIAKQLIENGADCHEQSKKGYSSLQLASKNGHLEVVNLLLASGAGWRCADETGWTSIYLAAINNHVDVVSIFLEEGASFKARVDENDGLSLLCAAISGNYLGLAKLIIDKGASVEEKWLGTPEATPLCLASSLGHLEMVELLLEKGVDVNAVSKDSVTPLHEASMNGHSDIVKLLIQDGADMSAKTEYAAEYSHELLVELLTTEDCSELITTDNFSRTPLHYACKGGHFQIVKWMLGMLQKTPETIDRPDHWGSTPLSMAVRKGHAGVVKLLLDTHAVDIGSIDKFGRTLVWWATEQGHSEILRLLTKQNQSRDLEGEAEAEDGQNQVCITCDICCLDILSGGFHSCESCHGGDFDICPQCSKLGGSCLDDSHSLVPRRV